MPSRIKIFFPVFIGILFASINTGIAQLQSPLDIALRHLEQNQEELNLTKIDLANYFVSDLYTSKHNGVTHVYLVQQHDGIILRNAIININILPNGKVLNMGNRFASDLKSRVNTNQPSIAPSEAIQKVIDQFQITTTASLRLQEKVNDHHFIFGNEGIALEPIPVKLVYALLEDKSIRLAWNVKLYKLDAQNWWDVRIDAQTGEVLAYHDQVIHCDFSNGNEKCDEEYHQHESIESNPVKINATIETQDLTTTIVANSYNVFPMPVESPNHGNRALLTDPADGTASPFGWHDTDGISGAEYTITRGNNVHAYHDIGNENNSIEDEPDGGSSLDFDFPLDLSQNLPYTQISPAVVNLFYWNNVIHDVWYQYGFDEASGNFQTNNYGNGGLGEDYVRAEALDGGGINNANMATPEDGMPPRMQMYVWMDDSLSLPPVIIPPSFLEITAPVSVAGQYEFALADFGPDLPVDPLISEIVLVDDGVGTTSDACQPIINGAEINGKIALIDRGGCNNPSKILKAQNNGAIAVIICNSVAGPPFPMQPGSGSDDVTIPSVMISLQDCNTWKTALAGLTVSIQQPAETYYEVPLPGPTALDGDYDNGIIIHEYTHGISTRLTGGPSTGCLTGLEQAGEGWSDWFALAMLTTPANTAEQRRGMGTFALNQSTDSTGIREFPYSRDMDIDPHTYGDVPNVVAPHGVGSVWAVMIWDLYWNMIDIYGFDEDFYNGTGGNNKTMQLVLDGLKLQPCSPTFIDSRDAILAADEANYNGENKCLIWETFARRGLGFSAESVGVEAFDTPEICQTILKITKTAVSEAFAGDVITYTLEITNDSPELLSNTTVTDILPNGTSYVAGSASCTNTTVDNGVITIEIGNMAVGETTTCTYQLEVAENPFSYSLLEDDVENGTSDWEVISGQGAVEWTVNPNSYEGDFAWYAQDIDSECDQYLILATPYNLNGDNPALSFWHRYATEVTWDGGVVEISTDDGLTWIDLGDDMIQNGYNGNLMVNPASPISGRPAFHGNSGGFIETIIDLSNYAQQDMIFRFRFGCDGAVGGEGWYIDNITLFGDLYSITNEACVSSGLNENACSNVTTTIFADIVSTNTISKNGLNVTVFPNPTNSHVIVKMDNLSNSPAMINLLNINGQLLHIENLDYSSGTFEMDLSDFPSGIYMIHVQTDEAKVVQKVVRQ